MTLSPTLLDTISGPAPVDAPHCLLSECRSGSRATVVGLEGCHLDDACRLRALGICEGSTLGVVAARHAMILDVRGTRLALGRSLATAVMVQPTPLAG